MCTLIYFLHCRAERCETDQGFAPGSFQFGGMHCGRGGCGSCEGLLCGVNGQTGDD